MHDSLLPGRNLRILAALGCVVMIALAVYALRHGYAWAQFSAIASIRWGQVLVADLYLGLALFSAWVIWRDGASALAAVWIVALLLLGNIVACVYVLLALRHGDGQRFWHGSRADQGQARSAA